MKKVLLVVIDAFAGRIARSLLQAERLPHMAQLVERGEIHLDSSAVFPSITPAATSTLATGRYPRGHNIAGNYWYETEEKTVVYYGSDILAMLNKGIGDFFDDFLVRFNQDRLQAPTIFERVEEAGMQAACLNFLIYYGVQPHIARIPAMLEVVPGIGREAEVHGPTLLSLGDMVIPTRPGGDAPLKAPGGPLHKFGFDDDSTGALLRALAESRSFPDFTLAYFPDNDQMSHKVGPEEAADIIIGVDRWLGSTFDAYGGIDALLEEVCILVTGDHGQCNIVDNASSAGINLSQLLNSFSVAAAGAPMDDADDLVVCPNLRTAQIYFHTPSAQRLAAVAECLLVDQRVDQLFWTPSLFDATARGYRVQTRDRGEIHFWVGADGPDHAVDDYGCAWSWEGDLRAIDGRVESGRLLFDSYPNACERIAGLLDLHNSGHLVATAQPGHEFRIEGTGVHTGGGSHASLHVLDSTSPLILTGAPEGIHLPSNPRSVDVTPLCLQVLGLEAERRPGASHGARNHKS